jgi:RNA polymerase sigma-70 factor (ECF subfamily)
VVQAGEDIARRLQNRDHQAWSELYEEYFPKVYRYVVLRVGNRTEAEDLAEQVFLKALESISSFKWRGVPVPAWLFRIAHNQVVDYWRNTKSKGFLPLDEDLVQDDADPQKEAEMSSDIQRVKGAMGQLTKAQRDVIELRFAGELSTAEVAKALGKSEGAVKVLQHNALVALRKKLGGTEQT